MMTTQGQLESLNNHLSVKSYNIYELEKYLRLELDRQTS